MKAMMLLNPKRRRRRSRRRGAKRRMRANPISRRRRSRRSRRGMRSNPIANLNPHRRRRRSRRRGFRRNPFGGGKIGSTIKGIFGKDNLVIAGGAVLGTLATGYILRSFGSKLPGATKPIGAIAYSVGIPALLAALAASASPKLRGLAQGMGIIAAVNLVSTAVAYAQGAMVGATAGTSAYLDAGNGVRALPNRPPGYDGVNAFGQSIYGNESAFRGNTWATAE